jgi:predicted DNA-binding transcriptional regulator YafY
MDALLRNRAAVSAAQLARDLNVSVRTLYRDMQVLKDLGAPIDGEAGVGYVLRSGFFLPPLMFTREELEAIVLGTRWVGMQPDKALTEAAKNALGKIAAAAPSDLRAQIDDIGLWPVFFPSNVKPPKYLGIVRESMAAEKTLRIRYGDAEGRTTEREVWPVQVLFHEDRQLFAGWCLLRKAFRYFRADRVLHAEIVPKPFGKPRSLLTREWEKLLREEYPDCIADSGLEDS